MNIQRLRNLTTGKLHTIIDHVYQDIEYITGEKGIMTHNIPNALKAIKPYLKSKVEDPLFWDNKYSPNHIGEIQIEPMGKDEQEEFWKLFLN